MKSTLKLILCIFLFSSCSTSKMNRDQNCNENISFKKQFFEKIENVESYVKGEGERLKFLNAIEFLSKYVTISNHKMLNYNNSYASLEDYNMDKKSWILWYEKNKCDNLKLKIE